MGKGIRQKEGTVKSTEQVLRRQVSCVLTAGTITDSSLLLGHDPQYLLVLRHSGNNFGFVLLDAAGGVFLSFRSSCILL